MQNDEIIIYADYMSQPSRAVLSFCYILGIDFKLVEVRVMRGETYTEEYKKISPAQTVPTMVHGKLCLYESGAILTYLADKFSSNDQWYPKDPKTRAKIDNYLHWHHMNIRFGCGYYIFNRYAAPKLYGRQLEGLSELATTKRLEAFTILESSLTHSPYIAGTSHPTIADLSCYPEIIALSWVNESTSSFPNLTLWMARVASIPEVKKSHEVFAKLSPRVKI